MPGGELLYPSPQHQPTIITTATSELLEDETWVWSQIKAEARRLWIHAIGKGILFDHATGVMVGEIAVIGDNALILHHVTFGGTGKLGGDRHPKITGSVVLIDVLSRITVVGNPARLVVGKKNLLGMKMYLQSLWNHISFISEWSDCII
ncbi:hypothetical protein MKW98_027918 [Papaver atlanticum]|uniref:Serine acetyltransferase n=1 Tax=Papaver atlanticum TaxID=357466 RepID=A0AAD4SAN7_9MAGN|nr:hypothetical protein MKW98_027918 [Papaver atlanticum]